MRSTRRPCWHLSRAARRVPYLIALQWKEVRPSVCPSVSQSVSQSVSLPVSQSTSQSVEIFDGQTEDAVENQEEIIGALAELQDELDSPTNLLDPDLTSEEYEQIALSTAVDHVKNVLAFYEK